MTIASYPLSPSQLSGATVQQLISFAQDPTLVARRLSEILAAQNFLSHFLLTGRYTIEGGAIAVPKNEVIRTQRRAAEVAPGAEYKLTVMDDLEYDIYTAAKRGIATEITDEAVKRLKRQSIDDALLFLRTELIFDADDIALGVVDSKVTQTHTAGGQWTTGKQVFKDAELIKAKVRAMRMGYNINTAVLPGELYAEVLPELLDVLPKDSEIALTGSFPTVAGITWVSDDTGTLDGPMFLDRDRLGGLGREDLPSPEYRKVGDTGAEVASIRVPERDLTRLQARKVEVPVILNPLAAFKVTGATA